MQYYIKQILLLLIVIFAETIQAKSGIIIPGYSPNNGWAPNQNTQIVANTNSDIPYDDASDFFTKARNKYIKWNNHELNPYVTYKLNSSYILSDQTEISFLMYSERNTNSKINFVFKSDNKDYLRYPIHISWSGWKLFTLRQNDFISSTKNKKNNINSLSLISNGWKTQPSNLNEIIISDVRIHNKSLDYKINYTLKHTKKSIIYTHHINIINLLNKSMALEINKSPFITPGLTRQSSHNKIMLSANGNETINISTEINYDTYKPLTKIEMGLTLAHDGKYVSSKGYHLATPLKQTTSKLKTIINDYDVDNIIKSRKSNEWINEISSNIYEYANNINKIVYQKYGVDSLSPPITEGEWGMKYIAKDGSKIYIKPESFNNYSWQHCTDQNTCIESETFDKVINGKIHNDLAIGAFRLGLAYNLYGDETYAKKAETIINKYIASYLKYPLHGINSSTTYNQARIHSQNFEEARWLIYIMLAYDLIKDNKGISRSTYQSISDKIIYPSIELLNKSGAPNQTAWNLAAKVISGYLLDDPIQVYNSLYGRDGFVSLLKDNITSSGEWKEGSWSYYFYAVEPILLITESSIRRGVDLYSNVIEKLLASPSKQILPDGSLPSFGDTRNKIYPEYYNYIFRVAQKRFNYNKLSTAPTSNIKDIFSLIWTYDIVSPKQKNITSEDKNIESDTIILRNSSKYGNKYLALKHSSTTPHSHLDNLSYIYNIDSREYIIDPGTTMYSDELASKFYNQSIAHNTVTINEKSHKPSKGQEIIAFNSPKLSLLHAQSKHSYNSTSMDRIIILKAEYNIDIFEVDSHKEAKNTIDLSTHSPLIETNMLSNSSSLFSGDTPHKYLRDITSERNDKDFSYTIIPYNASKKKLDYNAPLLATLIGEKNTTIIKGSYKAPKHEKNSVILARREGQNTTFITLYQDKNIRSQGDELKITSKHINNKSGILITIGYEEFIDYHYLWNKNIKNAQKLKYTFYRKYIGSKSAEVMMTGTDKSTIGDIEINAVTYEKYLYFEFNDMTKTVDIHTSNPDNISVNLKPKTKYLYEEIYVNGKIAKSTTNNNTIIINSYITR